jgi:hypothetical protein
VIGSAFDWLEEQKEVPVEFSHGFEVGPLDAGDYAVEWVVYYYTKEVRQLLQTRLKVREAILREAADKQLDLATPMLNSVIQP